MSAIDATVIGDNLELQEQRHAVEQNQIEGLHGQYPPNGRKRFPTRFVDIAVSLNKTSMSKSVCRSAFP
jgi:hypothetical protein